MIRSILAAVVSYIAIVLIVMTTFSAAYLALGTERSFQSGSFKVSFIWIVISIVLGFAAAVAGGFICQQIAKNSLGPKILVGLILVLGLLMAIPTLTSSEESATKTRSGDLENFEAMSQAQQPAWLAILNPFLGAVAIMIGARIKK
jgi:hypothetical protein